jgi:hypothetical protein
MLPHEEENSWARDDRNRRLLESGCAAVCTWVGDPLKDVDADDR